MSHLCLLLTVEIEITEVEPDFNGYEVAPERYEWWKNRIMKTAELL